MAGDLKFQINLHIPPKTEISVRNIHSRTSFIFRTSNTLDFKFQLFRIITSVNTTVKSHVFRHVKNNLFECACIDIYAQHLRILHSLRTDYKCFVVLNMRQRQFGIKLTVGSWQNIGKCVGTF